MLLLYEFSRGNQVDGSPRVAITSKRRVIRKLGVGSGNGLFVSLGMPRWVAQMCPLGALGYSSELPGVV